MITTRGAKSVDQPLQEPAGGLRITLLLHENVEHGPIRVDCPLEPELLAIDGNNGFIQMPFVTGARSVALDAISEMTAKPVHPVPDGFPADHHAAFGKQILDIRRAERETMIRSERIGDDPARKTVVFEARHRARYLHTGRLCKSRRASKLAMPSNLLHQRIFSALYDERISVAL